jgi:hypothetical protein
MPLSDLLGPGEPDLPSAFLHRSLFEKLSYSSSEDSMGLGYILLELDRPGIPLFAGREGAGARPGCLRSPPVPLSASAPCLSLWVCLWYASLLGCFWRTSACPPLAPPHSRRSSPNVGSRSEPAGHSWQDCQPLLGFETPLWYLVPSPSACPHATPNPRPRGL